MNARDLGLMEANLNRVECEETKKTVYFNKGDRGLLYINDPTITSF